MAENRDLQLGFDLIRFAKICVRAGAGGIGEYYNFEQAFAFVYRVLKEMLSGLRMEERY